MNFLDQLYQTGIYLTQTPDITDKIKITGGDGGGLITGSLPENLPNEIATNTSGIDVFQTLLRYILGFTGVVALLFIIFGGYTYLSAMGDENQMGKGKKMVLGAIIGLLIIMSAYTIIATVVDFAFYGQNFQDFFGNFGLIKF